MPPDLTPLSGQGNLRPFPAINLIKNPSMNDSTMTQIKDTTANPAPLGLLGFGMTTVLLNLHNAGFYELNGMILAMGLCYGGAAQIIAGIMEWKKGNTFATTAFISYGFFLAVARRADRAAKNYSNPHSGQ